MSLPPEAISGASCNPKTRCATGVGRSDLRQHTMFSSASSVHFAPHETALTLIELPGWVEYPAAQAEEHRRVTRNVP